MDTTGIPAQVPVTVTRPRPLIETIMARSLDEQGNDSRTAAAWRWVLTGHGPAPISEAPGTSRPPTGAEIAEEARCDPADECSWPPWRYAFDKDPDRQQARRVLRWLTGAADAIPLLDLDRGRYVGARLYLSRADAQLRQARDWAQRGLATHDLPEYMPMSQARRPWQWSPGWMDAAWLRGTIAYLDWVLGDQAITPVTREHRPIAARPDPDPRIIAGQREMYGVAAGRRDIEVEIYIHAQCASQQGREGHDPADPTEWPPPQSCEAVEQAHHWATGEDSKPPVDRHGHGDYVACPGDCTCYTAGHCLQAQCPACADRICNAGWQAIVENY